MLSGGEAQRVGIARALINSPAVCFADEPTGQLNHDNTDRVLNLLTGIHRDGQSIVLVTHDPHVAARGSRVLYLRDGGVVDELVLGRYQGDDHARSQHLNGFLTKMGW
jgi:lipoprotein ABC transporter, ATP-binding protein